MSRSAWIWVIIIVLVALGGWWLLSSNSSPVKSDDGTSVTSDAADDASQPSQQSQGTLSGTVTAGVNTAPMSATVTYNGTNFSPSTVTIAKGGTVTFTSTGGNMWVASNPHPIHTDYDGTSMQTHCAAGYTGAAPFDQCKAGTSYTFTFTKSGSWGYHNHMNHSASGTIVVQ